MTEVLGCNRTTIRRGLKELTDPRTLPKDRIRRQGGGAKAKLETIEGLDAAFWEMVRAYTAGDPMREEVLWTNLAHQELATRLRERGMAVSVRIVKQLLRKHHFKKRKARKSLRTGENADRDAQFRRIAHLRTQYEAVGNPIISIDTKKNEYLGLLYREGRLDSQESIPVYDHDFSDLAEGVAIPYAIYDLQRNTAWVSLGISKDTACNKETMSNMLVRFRVGTTWFLLLTDRRDLTTFQVILLYAYRWQVELIFRFLKRTMKGIHLINQSQDGVTIHFYMLLIVSLLQLALKQQTGLAHESSSPAPSQETLPQTPETQEFVHQSQQASQNMFHDIPSHHTLSHPYHFFEMIGEKLNIYWKIGIHWLSILRSILPQPFNDRALELLGSG